MRSCCFVGAAARSNCSRKNNSMCRSRCEDVKQNGKKYQKIIKGGTWTICQGMVQDLERVRIIPEEVPRAARMQTVSNVKVRCYADPSTGYSQKHHSYRTARGFFVTEVAQASQLKAYLRETWQSDDSEVNTTLLNVLSPP